MTFAKDNMDKIKEYFDNDNMIIANFPNKAITISSNFTKLLLVKAVSP